MTWPPTLAEMKTDQKVDLDDTRDDERFQTNLDAAVAFVERNRPRFNYRADPLSAYPDPTADLHLGTIRLAARWKDRTRSPDGMVAMGEMGSARVTSFDPDIDRMLRIGRFAVAIVG
jgi:hypothetical protein